MAAALNRPAIFVDLAAFVLVSVFCISTEAPIIQQDILWRCQDALLLHRIPIRGLSVDGRDVLLSGSKQSPITSKRARSAVEAVNGVRVVTIRVSPAVAQAPAGGSVEPSVQQEIDRLLGKEGIAFKAGTTSLTPESESALDKIATYLSEASSLQCEIRSSDAATPEVKQDRMLAFERALATEDYLEAKGIAGARLSIDTYHPGNTFHAGEDAASRTSDNQESFLIVRIRD
jgi:outer membrane protein OmpA-like peptidoglycan-associated protein